MKIDIKSLCHSNDQPQNVAEVFHNLNWNGDVFFTELFTFIFKFQYSTILIFDQK